MRQEDLRPNMLVVLPAPYNRGRLPVDEVKMERGRATAYSTEWQCEMAVDCDVLVGGPRDHWPEPIEFSGGDGDCFLCLGQLNARSYWYGYMGLVWVFLYKDKLMLLPDWLFPSLKPAT